MTTHRDDLLSWWGDDALQNQLLHPTLAACAPQAASYRCVGWLWLLWQCPALVGVSHGPAPEQLTSVRRYVLYLLQK